MTIAGGGVAAALVLVGFASRPHVNPEVTPERTISAHVEVTPGVQRVLDRVCNDCHSNETRWPWYSRVPPASWMIEKDVEEARKVLNFSEWPSRPGVEANRAAGLLMAACGAVDGGVMPPERYTRLHPEAQLTRAEKDEFCAWSTAQATRIMVANRRAREQEQLR